MESEGYMTTTDARGWIAALIKAMHEETNGSWPDPEYKDEVYSALEMAIKALKNHDTFMKYAYSQGKQDALEQQPCEDAVSREAVMDCFKKWQPYMATRIFDFEKELSELPPVTPSRPKGKWIDDEFGSKCSCCGIHTHLDKFDRPMKFKYCSMCGADMRGAE